jgi:pSer/pThr/pTyr-binding forkhead associated (FHA) protein
VPPFVLLILKVVFLGLLYLFVYRVVRAVAVDVRRTRTAAQPKAAVPAAATRVGGRSRPPRSLVVTDERGVKGQSYRLDGSVRVGRADDCEVRLSDTYVSSEHARLYERDGTWYVEDLGSTNGTYVNQRRITGPAELRAGDRVRVGKTVLELRR